MNERRENCLLHDEKLKAIEKIINGNGQKSLPERITRVEVLLTVVIGLLITNGGLLAWTIKTIGGIK